MCLTISPTATATARRSTPGLRRAWKETSHDRALEQLTTLAAELNHAHPGAAASLREGMEETLTVTRLEITGKLKLTLPVDQSEPLGHDARRTELLDTRHEILTPLDHHARRRPPRNRRAPAPRAAPGAPKQGIGAAGSSVQDWW